jgi:hypothetical protein
LIDFEQLIIEHSSAFKSDFVGLADFRKYLAVFSLHGPEEYIISEAIKVMSNEPFDYRMLISKCDCQSQSLQSLGADVNDLCRSTTRFEDGIILCKGLRFTKIPRLGSLQRTFD